MIMAVFEGLNRNYNLKVGKYLIGRDTDDTVHDIPIDDRSVDIKHAILEVTSSDIKILDLHTKHGTYINGTRIDWMTFIDVPKKATIKVGDIKCQIKPASEHDSGFENALNNTDDFEIIPDTPQQKGSNNLDNAFNDSIINSSFLVPNTQYAQRKSYENIFDISVQRNIKEMEEQDEYYIPETQEVFHKPLGLSQKNKDDIIRISMVNEDSNLSNASNDLLQDINASIPIPLITHSPVVIPEHVLNESISREEISTRLHNNDNNNSGDETDCEEEMSTIKWNDSSTKSKNDEINDNSPSITPDLDLDAIGNMNENLELRTKSVDDIRSTSVTPDLVIPNLNKGSEVIEDQTNKNSNDEQSNVNENPAEDHFRQEDEIRSTSVTPDLVIPNFKSANLNEDSEVIEDQTNKNSNEEQSNINENPAEDRFRQEDEIRSTSVTPDLDLEPTQPFIYHPPENNVHQNQMPNTSSNVSPSNKENNSSLAQKYTSDFDQTQKFFSNMPQKDATNLDKTQVFSTSMTHKNISILDKTQPFVTPTNRAMKSKDKSMEEVKTPLKTKSVVKDLFNNEEENTLLPTQAFEFKKPSLLTPSFKQSTLRPRSPSPLLLESDDEENNSEFCLKETLVVGEDPILENDSKINEKETKKDESRKNKILSSSEDESDKEPDNMTELSKQNREESSKSSKIRTNSTKSNLSSNKSTKSMSSSKSTPVSKSPCDFDLLTPVCDFINLPGINKMKEAGKHYSHVIKKNKISKTLLEETSSEEEDDTDDEVFLSPYKEDKSSSPSLLIRNSVNDQKKEQIKVEKSSKQLKDDKKVQTSDKNNKNKNNELQTRKKVKLTKIDEKKEKNKGVSEDNASSSTLQVSSTSKESSTKKSKDSIDDSKSSQTKKLKVLVHKAKSKNSSGSSKTSDATETSIKVTRSKKLISDEPDGTTEEATSSKSLPARRGGRLRSLPNKLAQDYYVNNGKEEEEESLKENKNNQKKKLSNERSEKKSKSKDKVSTKKSRKRASSSTTDCEYEPPASKTSKKSSVDIPPTETVAQTKTLRQIKQRVLFTKVDDAPYRRCLRSNDVEIVSNLKDCTLVVSDKIYRTWKLLGGIAKGVPIVSISWITALQNKQKDEDIPNYYDYLINDIEAERRFEFCLKESLERANQRSIFKGMKFFITKNTEPSPAQLKEIIKSGKGEILSEFPTTIDDDKNLIAISDKRDSRHWRRFKRAGIQIISTEAIMISVLQQKINFNKYTFSA